MTERNARHATIVMERVYDASPARVFAAWADPRAREDWSVPNKTTRAVHDQADFRVGGEDRVRCIEPDQPVFHAITRYADIVDNERIVMSEVISSEGVTLAVALITVEFRADGARTRQTVTDQIVALDGSPMIEGYNQGWNAALDNLAAFVRRQAA